MFLVVNGYSAAQSPPARVAWIETLFSVCIFVGVKVATREGGVDRNSEGARHLLHALRVATREGGVDRNYNEFAVAPIIDRRHPRGWRG